MQVDDVISWVATACNQLPASKEELTELDAAAGDGDLGVTVSVGAVAVADALEALPSDSTADTLFTTAGAAFARGNPSSYAALAGAGLLAAARAVAGRDGLSHDAVVAALRMCADKISERGRASTGQRTVLDALEPSIDALEASNEGLEEPLEAMIRAAHAGAEATKEMRPAKGRAAWVGDRSAGIPDAGAVAYVRLLEALAMALQKRASQTSAAGQKE